MGSASQARDQSNPKSQEKFFLMIIFKPLPSMQSQPARLRTRRPNRAYWAAHRARFLRHQGCIASVGWAVLRAICSGHQGCAASVYNFHRERSVIMSLQRMKSNPARLRATRPNRAWWAALRARCLRHQGCEESVQWEVLHAACFCHQGCAASKGNFRRAGSVPVVRPPARRLTFLCNAKMLLPWVEALKETNLWCLWREVAGKFD